MYELFEHTADLGLRAQAPDLDQLFAEAARGLFAMVIENAEDVQPRIEVAIEIEGTDLDYLFFDWLNELLHTFETDRLLLTQFTVHVSDVGLRAEARGEQLDRQRHHLSHEVKAITYHHLKVEQAPGGWQAEVIVDI